MCVSTAVLCAHLRAEVRVVGSDLFGTEFAEAIAAFSRRSEQAVTLDLTGSREGFEQLEQGQADLGLLVLAPGEPLPAAPYAVMPLAYHVTVVLAPASLPIDQISFPQLAAIYGEEARTSAKRWADIGVLAAPWAQRSILACLPAASTGLATNLFRYTVLPTPQLRPTIAVTDTVEAALQRVRGEEGGIAVVPAQPSIPPGLKVLLLAKSTTDVAFAPTPENVHRGDYPLRLPVYLVFRKASARDLQRLLRFLLSEDAVPVFERAGLVPLPIGVRNQQIFDLEVM